MDGLPILLRLDGAKVIVDGQGAMAEAKLRLVERAGAVAVGSDDTEARIAFLAGGVPVDPQRSRALADVLRARGVLVNIADDPAGSDFFTPSILERGPVTIAVSSAGKSAGLAKALRLRLEAIIPQSLGLLASDLGGIRSKLPQIWPDFGARRAALDDAFRPGGVLDPLAAYQAAGAALWIEEQEAALSAGQAAPRASSPSPQITIIALDGREIDQITLRELRALGGADVVFHEAGAPPQLLAMSRADAQQRELDAEAVKAARAHSAVPDGGDTLDRLLVDAFPEMAQNCAAVVVLS